MIADTMITSLMKRFLAAVVLLIALTVAGFAILRLMPGDFVTVLLTTQMDGQLPTPEVVAAFARERGFDDPLPLQYVRWLGQFLSGDMGRSLIQNRPVADMLADGAWNSLLLTTTTLVAALLVAIPAAATSALRPNTIVDRLVMMVSVTGMSIPTFWYALLASLLFALYLGLLPSSGFSTPAHIVLPTLVAATGIAGLLARYLRTLFLEESVKPYMLAARASGCGPVRALVRHAFPNAMPAILTIIGAQIIYVFEGMLVIETIFNWPGMGRLFVNALMSRDFPVIQACFITIGGCYVISNLLVDMTIAGFDRRAYGTV
jgi:peptide/nickel transport system permease protein